MSTHANAITLAALEHHTADTLDLVAHNKSLVLLRHGRFVALAYAADDVDDAHRTARLRYNDETCLPATARRLLVTEEQFEESPTHYIDRMVEGGDYLLIVARDNDGLAPYIVFQTVKPGIEARILAANPQLFAVNDQSDILLIGVTVDEAIELFGDSEA